MLLIQLTILFSYLSCATSLNGWAPTKAPKWYKNFPPWWISKVSDPGYKDATPVTITPLSPLKPPPPSTQPYQGMPKKLTDALTKGAKKFLDFPTKQAEDTSGATSLKNDGGAMYEAIIHANDHSKDRVKGKKNPDLAVLEDPVFNKQAPNPQPMKGLLFIEQKSNRKDSNRKESERRLGLRGKRNRSTNRNKRKLLQKEEGPPMEYNVEQNKMWVQNNNVKEETLKSRVGQQLPLWDPYWQTHRSVMPTFQSSSITKNAFLHYKNSPFDLYSQNVLGLQGSSGPANANDVNDEENPTKEDTALKEKQRRRETAAPYESDSDW